MHRHVWKIESQVTQPSAWEQTNIERPVGNFKATAGMFVKPVIVTYVCECGAQKVERV